LLKKFISQEFDVLMSYHENVFQNMIYKPMKVIDGKLFIIYNQEYRMDRAVYIQKF